MFSVGRIFRGFLALKAAVFGVVVLILWLRSYAVADSFRKGVEPQYIELGSARGAVIVRFGHDGNDTHLVGSWRHVRAAEPADLLAEAGMYDSAWNRIGFGYTRQIVGSPPHGVIVNLMLPHWLVFLLAIPSAVRWVWRWSQKAAGSATGATISWCPTCWREHRGALTHCPSCGGPVAVGHQPGAPLVSRT